MDIRVPVSVWLRNYANKVLGLRGASDSISHHSNAASEIVYATDVIKNCKQNERTTKSGEWEGFKKAVKISCDKISFGAICTVSLCLALESPQWIKHIRQFIAI